MLKASGQTFLQFLKTCCFPLKHRTSVQYKIHAANAQRILILCPAGSFPDVLRMLHKKHKKLFENKDIHWVLIKQDTEIISLPQETSSVFTVPAKKQFPNINRYLAIHPLMTTSFDIFLDLVPDTTWLGLFLCVMSHAAIRVSFQRTKYDYLYYNFSYRSDTDISLPEQISRLFSAFQRITA